MEWLINRRRMMFNKAVPPAYLTFESHEVWRICCENWGDYNETVITDNGNNTVDIVVTFKSMLNNVVRKSNIISTQTDVDNSGGTYVEGTTKEPVGITMKQCQAVTHASFDPSSAGSPFASNTVVTKFNEFRYFTGLTKLYTNTFGGCTSLSEITLPTTVIEASTYTFRQCSSLTRLVLHEGFQKQSDTQWIWGTSVQLLVLPSTVTLIDRYTMTNANNNAHPCTVICKAINPPSVNRGSISYSSSIAAVYVPDASVDTYKETSPWSTIATKIYPMSDYVES